MNTNDYSRVYVTQETSHDFTKAEAWGEVMFLTRDDLNNLRNSLHNAAVESEIKGKLKDFDEHNDWLIITGSPYVSALVFLILGNRGVKRINILRWDNRGFNYVPMHIELKGTR